MQDGCLADSNDAARYGGAILWQSEAMKSIYCRASLTMQIIIFILYYS